MYNAITPPTPLTPAAAPHSKVTTDGGGLLTIRTTGTTRAALIPSATTVTRNTLVFREASPAV
jgi:hypothetical protein